MTYNHEEFIAEALDSILMQDVDFLYEIVVGEDCSTDNTRQILLEYRDKHPDKFKLILHKENVGAAKNQKRVFDACVGKYVAILEGDDYWIDKKKLQKQFNYMEANTTLSMSFHNAKVIYDDENRKPTLFIKNAKKLYTTKDLILNEWFIPTQSIFLRRKCIENIPSSFDRVYNGDMAIQLICSTYGPIGYLDSVMSAYRKHSSSASMSYGKNGVFLYSQIIKLLDIFDELSNGRFITEIAERKKELQKQLDKARLRQNHVILFCIRYPIELIRYLLKSIRKQVNERVFWPKIKNS